MTKWTAATRKAYYEKSPENFAGPDMSYPIRDGSDVADAWGLAGHADNPDAVRSKIKSIAKRLGLTSSLPDTAKDDEKERSMGADHTHEALTRAASANHEPYTGTHSHSHDANDSQGDDAMHEHEHTHDNDNAHDHSHEERAVSGAIQTSDRPTMYAPFLRIDAAKREVIGQATAEVPDSYKTIFGYYPKAFELWRGNIREQHDPKKAVGRRVDFFPHDDTRSVDLLSRVSRGAPDTWAKVEDNVLTGYSLSVIPDPEFGNDISKWPKKEYEGKLYPYLPRYSIAEVSLVDNPACPGCNIQIVRADGFATDVLDLEEENPVVAHPEPVATSPESLERAGARLSAESRTALHEMRDKAMALCGCDECSDMQSGGDSDGDEMDRALIAALERVAPTVLERMLQPVYVRLQGIAGTLARSNAAPTETLNTMIDGAITRAVEAANAANASSLSEVRADLSAVKETVGKIADTPVPGAPVMHASALPRPVEKRLATDPYRMPNSAGATADAVAALWNAGQLDTTEKQVDAVAAALAAQRKGR